MFNVYNFAYGIPNDTEVAIVGEILTEVRRQTREARYQLTSHFDWRDSVLIGFMPLEDELSLLVYDRFTGGDRRSYAI